METMGKGPEGAGGIDSDMVIAEPVTFPREANLGLACVGGLAAAFVGAVLWAVITAVTKWQIGWMAVGVGFLVGIGVRMLGKGSGVMYGVIGAVFALLGCLAGNVLATCITLAAENGLAYITVIRALTLGACGEILTETFSGMDLVFYGLAVYEGFRFSRQ